MQNELSHHGVLGMKWGKRRYQNKDGTLTEAGKRRYYHDADKSGYKQEYKDGAKAGKRYKTGKKGRIEEYDGDIDKWVTDDLQAGKRLADESYNMSNKLQRANDQSLRRGPKNTLDLSDMTDQEMRAQINRAMLERQYNDMFAPQNEAKGREFVSKALETTGTVLTVGSSALGIALAIKELTK